MPLTLPVMARPKPPIAAWIARERHRLELKAGELAKKLADQGVEVTEQTIRVWESYSGRKPSAFNLEALERIFGSRAPVEAPEVDILAVVTRQSEAIADLLEQLAEERQERREATAAFLAAVQAIARAVERPGGLEREPLGAGRAGRSG